MKFFYSSASMGFHGEGYFWHKPFEKLFGKFPKYPVVGKTITLNPKKGTPWNVIRIPFARSTWNKIGLHNKGYAWWRDICLSLPLGEVKNLIPSLYGTLDEVQRMIDNIHALGLNFQMIEVNVSCPNVTLHKERSLPDSPFPLSLKLRHNDNPFWYDLRKVKRITLNSVPGKIVSGGFSGRIAEKYNWKFIEGFMDEMKQLGISIAGCSVTELKDIHALETMGCTEIGLGSVMLINPWLVLKTQEF